MIQFITSKPLNSYGTVQLRCFQPKEYLNLLGVQEAMVGNIRKTEPTKNGIIFFHRTPFNRFTRIYATYARSRGNILVYDTDDLTINANAKNHFAELCDSVTVSTDFLKEKFSSIHKDVWVIRNALSMEYLNLARDIYKARKIREKRIITIAYLSGSSTHNNDFLIIQDTLLLLLNKYDNIRILLAGKLNFSDQFFTFKDRFVYHSFLPYYDYLNLYKEIDINLAPLNIDIEFVHGKSELKYLEAGACGIPTIASPSHVYNSIINEGVNGLLSDSEEWYEKIEKLINDIDLRIKLGENSLKSILRFYKPTERAEDYSTYLNHLKASYQISPKPLKELLYSNLKKIGAKLF